MRPTPCTPHLTPYTLHPTPPSALRPRPGRRVGASKDRGGVRAADAGRGLRSDRDRLRRGSRLLHGCDRLKFYTKILHSTLLTP